MLLFFIKNTFTLFIIFIVKSLQKEQNSTNPLLWPPICRNKSAFTPKWFNYLDTNSIPGTYIDLCTKIAKNGHSAPSTRTSESLRKFAQLCRKKILHFTHKSAQLANSPRQGGEWDPRVFLVVEFKGLTIFEKGSCVLFLAAVLNHALLETWSLLKVYRKSAKNSVQSLPKVCPKSTKVYQCQLKVCPESAQILSKVSSNFVQKVSQKSTIV